MSLCSYMLKPLVVYVGIIIIIYLNKPISCLTALVMFFLLEPNSARETLLDISFLNSLCGFGIPMSQLRFLFSLFSWCSLGIFAISPYGSPYGIPTLCLLFDFMDLFEHQFL